MFKESNRKKQLVDGRFLVETGHQQVVLGEGLSARVILATDTWQKQVSNQLVALKVIQLNSQESKATQAKIEAYFKEESNILANLNHRNVIEMIAHGEAFILDSCSKYTEDLQLRKMSYIAFKLAEHGDLFDLISKNGPLTEQMA